MRSAAVDVLASGRSAGRPGEGIVLGDLALAAAGYALAGRWSQPAVMVTGLSVAALGIGATFVTAFTASLTDAPAAEGGLRSALVNTFHELGGAAGVAVLSSAAAAGLVMAHLGSRDFARAFTVGGGGRSGLPGDRGRSGPGRPAQAGWLISALFY